MNESQTQFSVVIPTFNHGYVLWKAIQSVQAQSWPHWELIVVDDGSTDDTRKVIAEFMDDPRIRYHYQPHQGIAASRNAGLHLTTGKIVTYLNSVDVLYSHFLQRARDFFHLYPDKNYALCNGNFSVEFYDSNEHCIDYKLCGPPISGEITLEDIYNWEVKPTLGTGFLFRREPFINKVFWQESLHPLEELDFLMQLSVLDESGFMHIPITLFEYKQRYGADGIGSSISYLHWSQAFEKVFHLHKNDPLMQEPEVYLSRIEKYKRLQAEVDRGEVAPAMYKYFPEHWTK